jgi:anion-transporting  ArsA/GET3 family ATPase
MPQNQAPAAVRLGEQKILFVSGKGGVGKSLVAAAIARREAKKGRRVLLAEIGDQSYYKDFFALETVGAHPQRVEKHRFDLVMWSGETSLREYVLHYLKLERIYRVFFENKIMRALINVAPGLNEIAILGKITSGIRAVGPSLHYDLIVVDCFATGHALALFEAAKGLANAIPLGPMGQNSRDIDHVLRDAKLCAFWVVTLLEEMPVTETLEFQEKLKASLGVDSRIIANKVMPLPVSEEKLDNLANGAGALAEFARYLLSVRRRQSEFAQRLEVGSVTPLSIPLIFENRADELLCAIEEALREA